LTAFHQRDKLLAEFLIVGHGSTFLQNLPTQRFYYARGAHPRNPG
jgi:hypothetical protein